MTCWPSTTNGILDFPSQRFFSGRFSPSTTSQMMCSRDSVFLKHAELKINLHVSILEVRKSKECRQHRWSGLWGAGGCFGTRRSIVPLIKVSDGSCHSVCNQTWSGPEEMCLTGLMRAQWHLSLGKGCVWLPKVTKLVQSKSGDLYLAMQMAHSGLCLGPLEFRLHCVLLREGVCISWSGRRPGEKRVHFSRLIPFHFPFVFVFLPACLVFLLILFARGVWDLLLFHRCLVRSYFEILKVHPRRRVSEEFCFWQQPTTADIRDNFTRLLRFWICRYYGCTRLGGQECKCSWTWEESFIEAKA